MNENPGCPIILGIAAACLLIMAVGYLLHVGWAAYTPGH